MKWNLLHKHEKMESLAHERAESKVEEVLEHALGKEKVDETTLTEKVVDRLLRKK